MLGLPTLGGLVCSPLPEPRQGHHEGQVCSGHGAAAAQLDVPAFQEATCHQASVQSVLPGHWGDAQQPFHFVSSQANLPICYDLLFRNQNAKPLRTRWSEAGVWFWRAELGLS